MIHSPIKAAWENGTLLKTILGHATEFEERFIYMALGIASEDESDGRTVASFFIHDPELKEFVDNVIALSTAHPFFQSLIGQENAFEMLREMIAPLAQKALQYEFLVGYGYLLPRALNDEPVLIPQDVWYGDINWKKSEVDGGGLRFASVHIAPEPETGSTDIFDVLAEQISAPGRPSKRQIIMDAFEVCVEQKLIDFSQTNTAIYENVRRYIQTNWPDEYGNGKELQDGAMQKHLASLIASNRL